MFPFHIDRSLPLASRVLFVFSMATITLITLAALASLTQPVLSISSRHNFGAEQTLADLALGKVLGDALPIFGTASSHGKTKSATATWMKAFHDDTLIIHMNLPGTHDAATWNYSIATQNKLDFVNDLANISAVRPDFYRCQSRSIAHMLDAGIRVFDLRYALDVTRTSLVFWHGNALQSETATVGDVLYSLYAWLDGHPSEALFLSFQHEGGGDDMVTQLMLYNTLTSPAAKRYVRQTRGSLGALGSCRGKITLLRRFDLDLLPDTFEMTIPGLHFSPTDWTDNGADITLVYNSTNNATAYMEDYYAPQTPQGSDAALNIRYKLNATQAHLSRAATSHLDSLFWSFASSTNTGNNPPDTPEIQALGNGTLTPNGGVNDQLLSFLKTMRGKRLGIVMFDFFEEPSKLLPTFMGLLSPNEARALSNGERYSL